MGSGRHPPGPAPMIAILTRSVMSVSSRLGRKEVSKVAGVIPGGISPRRPCRGSNRPRARSRILLRSPSTSPGTSPAGDPDTECTAGR